MAAAAPRRFQAAHPGIELRLSASDRVADLRHEDIDLAIRYAPDKPPSADALRLFGETVVAVAHPSFGRDALRTRQALARHTLLDIDPPRGHLRPAWLQWSTWLTRRGWAAAKPRGVLRFNQYDQIIHAALAGQGLALGRLPLLQPLIADGRLVVVDPARLETDYAYWLLRAKPGAARGGAASRRMDRRRVPRHGRDLSPAAVRAEHSTQAPESVTKFRPVHVWLLMRRRMTWMRRARQAHCYPLTYPRETP